MIAEQISHYQIFGKLDGLSKQDLRRLDNLRYIWHTWAMNTLTAELAQILSELDDRSASALEQLVRNAMELARRTQANGAAAVTKQGWPVGYFEQTAGSFAAEPFDLPDDPPPDSTPTPDAEG